MRIKILFFFISSLCFINCFAQSEKVIFLNENGKPVKEKEAIVLLQKLRLNDTAWEFNYYGVRGPIFLSIQTRDEKGSIKNGPYHSYKYGRVDTAGYYLNNIREHNWDIYTDSGQVLKRITYSNNQPIMEKDSGQIRAEMDKMVDSLVKDGKTFKKVEIESEYPGGALGWRNYLMKNLKYPDRAVSNNVQGDVRVLFIVNKEGVVEDISLNRSIEYSLDKEAIRIIQQSGKWVPAVQDGRKVKSYKIQPIKFRLG